MFGEEREYLTIKILHNDMTVMVPCENAGIAGLRRVIDEETVQKVLAVLQDELSEMPKNWNRRFKHNRDKIKTGDIYELAEVVRNLAIREHDKGLSTGEKQMFTRAKKILASELMYALGEERGRRRGLPRRPAEVVGRAPGRRREGVGHHLMSAVALVVAAGRGERLGTGGPKAFVMCGGRPMLEWSIDALKAVPEIGHIVVATPPGIEAPAGTTGVFGGDERSHSVRAALHHTLAGDPVLVHDAARPLVTPEIIRATLAGLDAEADAAIAAARVVDTVKRGGGEDDATVAGDAGAQRALGDPDAAGVPPRRPGAGVGVAARSAGRGY